MVNLLILIADVERVLQDQDGHLRNRACQKIDAHGNVVPGYVVVFEEVANAGAVSEKKLGKYNMTNHFYANRSEI